MKNRLTNKERRNVMVSRVTAMCLLLMLLFGVGVAAAGDTRSRTKGHTLMMEPMRVDDGRILPGSAARSGHPQEPPHAASITWVAVDTMANAFGPASRGIKPMAYDSATNIVALIHRGAASYAQSSGELWYNISRDAGVSWRRVPSGLNSSTELLGRYPSCAISNLTNSSDTTNVLFVWAAPLLLAGGASFGRVVWGADFPIGSASPFAVQSSDPDGSFWSNANIWTTPGSATVNWVVYRRGTVTYDDLYRWHTTDFLSYVEGIPPAWAASNFNNAAFGLDIRGEERNGINYFGKWGQWTGDLNVVDNPGYSVSSDGGVTWSAWTRPQPDFRGIPGMGSKDWWTYGGAGAYSFDMLVDANNKVHFFGVDMDTLTQQRDVVEIYETGTGWASNVIKSNLNQSTLLNYNTLNQMGNHLNASANPGGNVMALIWLDAPQGDSLPDIWFSWRRITDASWSTPQNLTQTPGYAELLLHAAPTLKANGPSSYTMFIGRSYESGVTTYPPTDVNPTVFYAGTHTFTLSDVGEGSTRVPQAFSLEQNYPNPFNPETKISYTVARAGRVTIRVYDILGKEVATLMDGERQPGSYQATFSAANLTSGVYYYRMTAGGYAATRRMIVVK